MSSQLKLHIGAGKRYLDGYIHVDINNSYKHIETVMDIRKLNKKYNNVDEIYSCHVLEHFDRKEVDDVLKEWYKCLKPGGKIRLAVPDFDSVVNRYNETNNVDEIMGLLYGGQRDQYDFHKIAFTFKTLSSKLTKIGFHKIERYDWKSFIPVNYDDYSRCYLPHMDFNNGSLMSLNVVAEKL